MSSSSSESSSGPLLIGRSPRRRRELPQTSADEVSECAAVASATYESAPSSPLLLAAVPHRAVCCCDNDSHSLVCLVDRQPMSWADAVERVCVRLGAANQARIVATLQQGLLRQISSQSIYHLTIAPRRRVFS